MCHEALSIQVINVGLQTESMTRPARHHGLGESQLVGVRVNSVASSTFGICNNCPTVRTDSRFLDGETQQGQTSETCNSGKAASSRSLVCLKWFEFLLDKEAESMSGPIVRTGTTPEFWKNWDRAFGDKKKQLVITKPRKRLKRLQGQQRRS